MTVEPTARERAERLMSKHIRTWTKAQLMERLHISADTAGAVLLGMYGAGLIKRQRTDLPGQPYEYWWERHHNPREAVSE